MVPPLMHKGRHDSQPKVTFYLTLVFELHEATDQYTYSIDRCYTSLAQANDRLGLLSRCNTAPNTSSTARETLRAGEDQDTGCQWCTWTRPGAEPSNFRFYASVQRIVMHGSIRRDGPSEQAAFAHYVAGGLASTAEYRYSFEHKKDLANHVWAVALLRPDCKITVDHEGKPAALPWTVEGVHEASGNAMARSKRLWRDRLAQKQGHFDRLDSHYGFARYLLVPQAAMANSTGTINNKRHSLSSALHLVPSHSTDRTAQIRVERIKVMPQGEMVAMFAPAEAILFDKPFQALCKSREKGKGRDKVQAELLDLFSAAGEDVAEHQHQREQEEEDEVVVVKDPRLLTPPPIRRKSLRSPPQQLPAFREGVVQDYAQLAATLREPVSPASVSKLHKARNRLSVCKSVASAKKHFYHSLVGEESRSRLLEPSAGELGSPYAKKGYDKYGRIVGGVRTAVVPPVTPGQAALAAQQTLLLASRVDRGRELRRSEGEGFGKKVGVSL